MNKLLTTLTISSLLLVACADDTTSPEGSENVEEDPEVAEVVEPETESETEPEEAPTETGLEQQVGDVVDAEGGSRTIVGQVESINETQETGPFEMTLLHAQLSQFQPAPDYVDIFGGEDLVLITFQVEVTNNSEETNTIYPDQGVAVTDTGEQVNAEVFLSDQVGGDFFGEVTKSGDVFFLYEGDAEEVSSVRFIIDAPHDESFESIGEGIEFTVDF